MASTSRLTRRLLGEGDRWPLGSLWGETRLRLPHTGAYVNVLTGERFAVRGDVRVAELLATFPIALLLREES